MILEQLIERKDLIIFCDMRIMQLENQLERSIKNENNKRKEAIRQRFHGRIKELKYVKKLIMQKQIKKRSKQLWNSNKSDFA